MGKCQNDLEKIKLKDLLKVLIGVLFTNTIPYPKIPSPLVLLGSQIRPGLSAQKITQRTLLKLSEAGIPVGDIYGKPNLTAKMVESLSEEIVSAIQNEAKVQVAIPPGGVSFTGVGGNAGGPVTVQGLNTNIVSGDGIMS